MRSAVSHLITVGIAKSVAKLWLRLQDVEICVPDDAVGDVSTILSYTGLFKKEGYKNLNAHNEYKSGCLRLVTTAWLHRPVSFVVFPASFYGLQPLDAHTFRPCEHVKSDSEFSKEILDTVHERDVRNWRFPRLAPYIASLAKRYLETGDDMAAMAVEHLVDGLDLSETWYDQQMDKETPMEVTGFVTRLIRGKKSRIAYYQEHKVTCMIADEEQASKLTRIPGYQW